MKKEIRIMKLMTNNFGKKTMVLAGAIAFSLAMGTVAYAGTADTSKADMKMAKSVPAATCTMAIAADKNAPLPEGVVMMEKIDFSKNPSAKGFTEVKVNKDKATDAMKITVKAIPATKIVKAQ